MTSRLLYDAASEGLWYWYIYPSLLPIPLAGAFAGRRIYRSAKASGALHGKGAFTRIALVGGLLFFVSIAVPCFIAWHSYSGYREFRDKLARGEVTVTEGTVEDFVAEQTRSDGKHSERFRIGTHEYWYAEEEHSPGYHLIRARGGVITGGLVLRVADIDGRIARIELIE